MEPHMGVLVIITDISAADILCTAMVSKYNVKAVLIKPVHAIPTHTNGSSVVIVVSIAEEESTRSDGVVV